MSRSQETLTTAEAAQLLGITVSQLMYRTGRDAIEVPRNGGRYAWTAAIVEELRAAQSRREAVQSEASTQGLGSHEAARQLGIPYPQLIQLIRRHQIQVPRVGPRRLYAFDEAALELVRAALQRPPAQPPPIGFTTRQVASALGVSYETLVSVMGPLRKSLPIQKVGGFLIWSAEAVRIAGEAVARRHLQQWLGEAHDYEQALRSLSTLAVTLQRLSEETAKLHGLLARKPAETAFIHALPTRTHALAGPLGVLLIPVAKTGFQASLAELSLVTEGKTRAEALRLMRQRLWARYREVSAAPGSAPAEWTVLQQLVKPL